MSSVRTRNAGVLSSKPPNFARNAPLARKSTGNCLVRLTSFLEKLTVLSLGAAKVEIEYATYELNAIKYHNELKPRIFKTSEEGNIWPQNLLLRCRSV